MHTPTRSCSLKRAIRSPLGETLSATLALAVQRVGRAFCILTIFSLMSKRCMHRGVAASIAAPAGRFQQSPTWAAGLAVVLRPCSPAVGYITHIGLPCVPPRSSRARCARPYLQRCCRRVSQPQVVKHHKFFLYVGALQRRLLEVPLVDIRSSVPRPSRWEGDQWRMPPCQLPCYQYGLHFGMQSV
jgi:hypothetical protein